MARVVVAGGSIAGLASALALSGHGHEVVVLERGARPPDDPDPAAARYRRLVPQGLHAHTLASLGVRVLRERAPHLLAALRAAGAADLDLLRALPPAVTDRQRVPGDEDLVSLGVRRGTLESVLHRLVAALPGVTVRHGTAVHGLVLHPSARRVTGVRTDGGTVAADIVLDATGRRAESRRWLAGAGLPVAEDLTCPSGLVWFSRFYRLHGSVHPGPLELGNAAGAVGGTHAGLLHPADNGTFSVALGILAGDRALSVLRYPQGFAAAAGATPGLGAWLADGVAEPLSPVHAMTVPHTVLRGTATVRQYPVAGLFVTGDAACTTGPLLARGMSLALAHAFALADEIAAAPALDVALARRAARLAEEVYGPWFHQSADEDRARIARWRAAVTGRAAAPVPVRPDGRPAAAQVEAAARTDARVWRALTRIRMGLATPGEVLDDAGFRALVRSAPDAGAPGPAPSRADLVRAVHAACGRIHAAGGTLRVRYCAAA